MIEVKIQTEYIKLDQFLKWEGIADSGTQAKDMIQNGFVKVNNEIEIRRGRKLRIGDLITVENKTYRIE